MATGTLGTTGTTVLTALNWNPQSAIADVAAIQEAILRQESGFRTSIIPGVSRLPEGCSYPVAAVSSNYIRAITSAWTATAGRS